MLLGPAMDTFEARADCRANKLTLTEGRERTVQDRPCTLLHGPIGRFLYRSLTEHCYDKPIKATTRRVYKFSKKWIRSQRKSRSSRFILLRSSLLTKWNRREDQDFRCERIHFFWKFVNTSSRCLKSPYGTMEQGTWPFLNCALPSPGQGQFVSPAIRSGFECVHRWSQQHDLSARMASFLRFTAL